MRVRTNFIHFFRFVLGNIHIDPGIPLFSHPDQQELHQCSHFLINIEMVFMIRMYHVTKYFDALYGLNSGDASSTTIGLSFLRQPIKEVKQEFLVEKEVAEGVRKTFGFSLLRRA